MGDAYFASCSNFKLLHLLVSRCSVLYHNFGLNQKICLLQCVFLASLLIVSHCLLIITCLQCS